MTTTPGRFLEKKFKNKKVEIYIGDQVDWLSYSDNSTMSYVLVVGVVKEYDSDDGILTLIGDSGQEFWISEEIIGMFWEADKGFKITDTMGSTIKTGKRWLGNKNDRDIM